MENDDWFMLIDEEEIIEEALEESREQWRTIRAHEFVLKMREKIWDYEHEETVIYHDYPTHLDCWIVLGSILNKCICFLSIVAAAVLLYEGGRLAWKKGFAGVMEKIKLLVESITWNEVSGSLFLLAFIGSFCLISLILREYRENTERIFTDKCVYVRRYLRKETIVTYEELAEQIAKRKICIRNGQYQIPCIGPDVFVSVMHWRFPKELFILLEKKCHISLPDEDIKERAKRSGFGWMIGRVCAGSVFFIALCITLYTFGAKGKLEWIHLFFEFCLNPLSKIAVLLVGVGMVINLFVLPSVVFTYREWRESIKVSLMPLLVDFLIVALSLGSYWSSSDAIEKYQLDEKRQIETEKQRAIEQQFISSFSEDVWGKAFEEITAEEFAQVKYISVDYGTAGKTTVHYSMVDYKDCADEQEFAESICTWQCEPNEYFRTPADISMLTGLTYVKVPEDGLLEQSLWAKENQITRMEITESPQALEGIVNPEKLEVLCVDNYESESQFAYVSMFPNLKELVYCDHACRGTADLSQLTCLPSLERIWLSGGESYVNLGVLQEADNLRALSIDKATLSECSFVREIKGLEELELCYGEDGDLTLLSDLPRLRRLWFLDEKIVDSTQLEALPAVEELKITIDSYGNKNVLELLKEKERIRALDITFITEGMQFYLEDETDIDLSVLAPFTELQELRIGFSGGAAVYGLEVLTGMGQLKSLVLEGDLFQIVAPLGVDKTKMSDNHSVESLFLRECVIRDLQDGELSATEFLTAFKNVKDLSVVRLEEGIESFEFLNSFENLETLTVDEKFLSESQKQEVKRWGEKIKVQYW